MKVCERGEELTIDLFLKEENIHNLAKKLAIEYYKRDKNDINESC